MLSSENGGADLVLADVNMRLKDYSGAEQAYRRVLRSRPGNPDAMVGLASALTAQGKSAEAKQIADRLSPQMRARLAGSGGGSNAERLRKEAKEAEVNNDPRTAAAKFNEAIADDPRNPWVRLDYARFQAGQGN